MAVSVVVPVLDEAERIGPLLGALRNAGAGELIVVDGGSRDVTAQRAAPFCDRLIRSHQGRAVQMNAGAAAASGAVLWFVHADSTVPVDAAAKIEQALGAGADWGWFDVRLSGDRPLFRVISWCMNQRARLTGIATGDQGLFVRRELFARCGGFPEQLLMEDIALCRRLRRMARRACLPGPIITSSRRWEERGAWRTIALMWRLRLAFALGADPAALHRRYYGAGKPDDG